MDVLLLATQRWEKPNITDISDMADTAIDGLILYFKVPLVKAGIEATNRCMETREQAKEETGDLFNIVLIITTSFML